MQIKYPVRGNSFRPAARGKVTSFSKGSRWRMRLRLACLDRDEMPAFVHLTYPEAFPGAWMEWKEALNRLAVAMQRRFHGLSFVWKLEFQERGAPHFHLLIYGLAAPGQGRRRGDAEPAGNEKPSTTELREWVSVAWPRATESTDEKHLRAGTRVERIRSPRGVQSYVAGYASKHDQTLSGVAVGRYWGKHNAKCLPVCELEHFNLGPVAMVILERVMRKADHSRRMVQWHRARARGATGPKPRPRRAGSFTLICDVGQWVEKLPGIIDGKLWWTAQRDAARPKRKALTVCSGVAYGDGAPGLRNRASTEAKSSSGPTCPFDGAGRFRFGGRMPLSWSSLPPEATAGARSSPHRTVPDDRTGEPRWNAIGNEADVFPSALGV